MQATLMSCEWPRYDRQHRSRSFYLFAVKAGSFGTIGLRLVPTASPRDTNARLLHLFSPPQIAQICTQKVDDTLVTFNPSGSYTITSLNVPAAHLPQLL